MKVLAASLLLATFTIVGCKHGEVTQQATSIIYDGYWSNDYAAQGAAMHCITALLDLCKDEARADEINFRASVIEAFETNPSCSGFQLFILTDPKTMSKDERIDYLQISRKPHWNLQVNYNSFLGNQISSGKQPWLLTFDPGFRQISSGESDSKELVRTVCAIARGAGGTVVS